MKIARALLPLLCWLGTAGIAQQPAVVHYPVNARGALLYMGDGRAAMGDAEIAGTAIEVPMRARVQVSVIRHLKIAWPRFESADAIMTAYRPLDDATRIAFTGKP
jgi:amidase